MVTFRRAAAATPSTAACQLEAALLGLIEDHGAEDISPFYLAAPTTVAVPSRYAIPVAKSASPLRASLD
jgi:hypothetical protein